MNSISLQCTIRGITARSLSIFVLLALLAPAPSFAARSISSPKSKPVVHGKRAAAASTALGAAEKRVAAAVDQHAPASLALLEAAVNVNSGTMNFAGVRQTASLFEPSLTAMGFSTRWVDGAEWGRAGHLLARRVRARRRTRKPLRLRPAGVPVCATSARSPRPRRVLRSLGCC